MTSIEALTAIKAQPGELFARPVLSVWVYSAEYDNDGSKRLFMRPGIRDPHPESIMLSECDIFADWETLTRAQLEAENA